MLHRVFRSTPLALVLIAMGSAVAHAFPAVPTNFAVENAFPGVSFVVPTKIAWLPDGRALVIEKRGWVWAVKNGVKAAAPMVAIDAEVLDANDRGLLSVAVDPNYFVNHFVYLLYTVDPDSNNTETNADAFGRLTRYTVNFTDSATVIASSRTILIGATWTGGIVSCSPSHTVGDLNWGADGSLLISAGDGASFSQIDKGGLHPGCFGTGKTSTYEDIGAFRAQSLSSLAGKILRINPTNGRGYTSNPYYDGNLLSIRSRVWAYGLRNPYHFTVRPGTGVADTAAGNPGVLFIGEVGYDTWEEQNIAKVGGLNFGWPCFEGVAAQTGYQGAKPAHNSCTSMGTSDNPAFQTSPELAYNHSSGIGSIPFYAGLFGNTAIGGVFYTGASYPGAYRQQYFFGDYGQSWVRVGTVDALSNLTSVSDFGAAMDAPVCFSTDPVGGDVLYISITTGEIRRIRYTGTTGNASPIAVANAAPSFGAAPLDVSFSSAGTYDPDADPFTVSWAFGDATGSTVASPAHRYNTPGTYTVVFTATDNHGGIGRDTVFVTATAPSTFPSATVLDNFNRPNGPIGGSWTVDRAGLVISGNALTQSASTDNWCIWNAATFGPNQEAWFTFNAVNLNAPEQDLLLKVQGLTWSAGEIECRYDGATHAVVVSTYTIGAGWQTRGAPLPITFVAGDRYGVRALADGTVEFYRNSGLVGTRSVAGWPYAGSGGRLGMTLVGIGGSLIDDFGGGDVNFSSNTPPTATVTSPANRSFFIAGQTVALTATASDAQDPTSSLAHHWDIELHHNTHIHFGLTFDTPAANFVADNHDDGTGVFYRIRLTVTDTGGLMGRDSVDIFPEIDLTPRPASYAPAVPTAVDSITYSFAIRNLGRLPANLSRWRLRAGASLLAEGDVIVPALDSVVVNLKLRPTLAAGTYPLRVVADTLGQVVETSETNNAATGSITIAPDPTNRPPVAAAGATPTGGAAPLNVVFSSTGSSDPDGDPLTYGWTFGDGGTGTGAAPSHVYSAAGNYTATLTVNDGRGGISTASVAIAVTAPTSAFPTTVVLDDFNRANGAVGGAWVNATGITVSSSQLAPGTADNSPVWNGAVFGADQEAYATFATVSTAAPEQDLMLKVQGLTWDTGHIEVRYDGKRKKLFVSTYAPTQGWVSRGSQLSLTLVNGDRLGARARPDGTVEVWRNTTKVTTVSVAGWPFAASGGRIGMTFSGASALRVDNFGGGTASGGTVNSPPVAVASGTPGSGIAPLLVSFSSAGSSDPDGDPLTFSWAFGDGFSGAGASVSHTYAIGNYTATLTVTDGRGGSATATVAISATATAPTFPTTSVLDNFNRADGPIGGSWVGNLAGLTISANQLAIGTPNISTPWNGATFGVSQEAFVTLASISPTAYEYDVMLKVQGLTWDTGHIEVRFDPPTSQVFVTTYAPTQGWVGRGTLASPFVSGDRLGARARADGTVEVYRNATLLGTASVAGWPFAANGGRVGLTVSGANGSRLDDFGGGNSAVAAAAAQRPADPAAIEVPGVLSLSNGWPNPAAGAVRFTLALPRAARVRFAVYDLAGREVWSEGERVMEAGRRTIDWSGATREGVRAPVGVYLVRVAVDREVLGRRVTMLR